MAEPRRDRTPPLPLSAGELDYSNLVMQERWPEPTALLVFDQAATGLTPAEVRVAWDRDGRIDFGHSDRLRAAAAEFASTIAQEWSLCDLKGDALSSTPTHLWVILAPGEDTWLAETMRYFGEVQLAVAVIVHDVEGLAQFHSDRTNK